MTVKISAYEERVELSTSDGSARASFDGTMFSQGTTPTSGTWTLSCGVVLDHCGSSGMFSEDGQWFAVPRWISEYAYSKKEKKLTSAIFGQQLQVVHLPTHAVYPLEGRYGVVELESFQAGVIVGASGGQRLTVRVAPS